MNQRTTPQIGDQIAGGTFCGRIRIHDTVFGLIVAPKAEGERRGQWLSSYTSVPDARSCFNGLANTLAMAEAGSELAQWALRLTIGGHTDWHLPARDALELMYRHLKPTARANYCSFRDGENPSSVPAGYPYEEQAPAQTQVAGFAAGGADALQEAWYWSSTQSSAYLAWSQYFGNGIQYDTGKKAEGWARAVRLIHLDA